MAFNWVLALYVISFILLPIVIYFETSGILPESPIGDYISDITGQYTDLSIAFGGDVDTGYGEVSGTSGTGAQTLISNNYFDLLFNALKFIFTLATFLLSAPFLIFDILIYSFQHFSFIQIPALLITMMYILENAVKLLVVFETIKTVSGK